MKRGAPDHVRSYFLHKLAVNLDARGFHATVKMSYPPVLYVFTPGASMMTERIDCAARADGSGHLHWYYRWSWGEEIGETDDPSSAAERIAGVLTTR